MAISLTIDGKEAALKKGSSIEYVSENRIFTDADDYSMEIELPLAECPQNINIFGHLTRKDVDTDTIFFDAILQDTRFRKDKGGEKLAENEENLLEHRTDGTDAFDTLYIGSEKFPYRDGFAVSSSGVF